MPASLDELEARIARLDAAIEPIATRPVDFSSEALDALSDTPHPLDEAGARDEAEALVLELVRDYPGADERWRRTTRALFARFESFAWAAAVPLDRATEEGLRAHLVLFSLDDQGRDPRDARMWLDDLVETANAAGLPLRAIAREVAEYSSDEDRFGWGSTRDWLMRVAEGRR